MLNLDHQFDYWNRIGPGKPFGHPVNLERLSQHLSPGSRILDLGCGYGRVLGLLFDHGYRNLIGFDPAPAMITMARARFPGIEFEEFSSVPHLPLSDASVDATILFSVLTCVPTDEGQRAIVSEVHRVLKPGGTLILVDSLQTGDARDYDALLDYFPYAFHEPYYASYVRENLDALFAPGFLKQVTDFAYFSKVVSWRRGESDSRSWPKM